MSLFPFIDLDPSLPMVERMARVERGALMIRQRWLWSLRSIGAMAIVLVVVGGLLYRGLQEAQATQRSSQIASCKRGNKVRAENNRSHLDDYRFDTALARLLTVALKQPEQLNARLTPAQREANRVRAAAFVGQLEGAAKDKEWTYLIADCGYAVDHPSTYHFPPAVQFSERMPPSSVLGE